MPFLHQNEEVLPDNDSFQSLVYKTRNMSVLLESFLSIYIGKGSFMSSLWSLSFQMFKVKKFHISILLQPISSPGGYCNFQFYFGKDIKIKHPLISKGKKYLPPASIHHRFFCTCFWG